MVLKKLKQAFLSDSRLPYLLIIPAYYIIFYIEEYFIRDNYFVTYVPFDDKIPFIEAFILPYYVWMPLLYILGVYFFNKDHLAYKKFMTAIGISFFTVLFIYAVFPNGQNLRPTSFERTNIFTIFVSITYFADTNTNVFPSLHVVGAIIMIIASLESKNFKNLFLKYSIIILSVVTAISTVFVKQHSIIDVIAAIPFTLIICLAVYKFDFPFCLKKQKK